MHGSDVDFLIGWEDEFTNSPDACLAMIGTTDFPTAKSARTDHAALISPTVLIRGAGEMASAVAWRLHMANIRRICMTELDPPLCVRRTVSFCTAINEGWATVEGVDAHVACDLAEVERAWREDSIAVVPRPRWGSIADLVADVAVDAILAKHNTATSITDADLVIALGPGFVAGRDCHVVIETNRGHHLGRIITTGEAEANTGVPGDIAGHTQARVLRAPADGVFKSALRIGDRVSQGDAVGQVDDLPVVATTDGILRGLILPGTQVRTGLKLGDIDPRANPEYCRTISDKARAIAGAVLEAVMRHCNKLNSG